MSTREEDVCGHGLGMQDFPWALRAIEVKKTKEYLDTNPIVEFCHWRVSQAGHLPVQVFPHSFVS